MHTMQAQGKRGTTMGWRLRSLRGAAVLTMTEAAAAVGISQAQLSRIELDQSSTTPAVLDKLARLYGASLDYIIRGDEPAAGKTAA